MLPDANWEFVPSVKDRKRALQALDILTEIIQAMLAKQEGESPLGDKGLAIITQAIKEGIKG